VRVEMVNVRERARATAVSTEMAARALRHEAFARIAKQSRATHVALGHHADDQVESFFLRLFRGSAGLGTGGMRWSGPSPVARELTLVRPLLNQSRDAIFGFALRAKLTHREDASNRDRRIPRNRIRHELLPLLKKHYAPALNKTILRVMEVAAADTDFVNRAALDWQHSRLASSRSGSFEGLHPAVQRAVIHAQLIELGLTADFDLIEKLRRPERKQVSVGPGLHVSRDGDGRLHFGPVSVTRFDPERLNVSLQTATGQVTFKNCVIKWELRTRRQLPILKRAAVELFDADRIGRDVVLRHWQPGDRFTPLGMPKPVKLQDLFINEKVLRNLRHELILATTAQGEIFWVEGLRISERFKLHEQTKRCLKWSWQRL